MRPAQRLAQLAIGFIAGVGVERLERPQQCVRHRVPLPRLCQVTEKPAQNGSSRSIHIVLKPVAIAGTVSAEYGRKYGADASAMTQVHIAMVAVPPPDVFLEWIRRIGQTPALPDSGGFQSDEYVESTDGQEMLTDSDPNAIDQQETLPATDDTNVTTQ